MSIQFGKVAVLMGGSSGEREVSLRSGKAIANGLTQAGIDATGIDSQQADLKEISKNYDRVFIALHGKGGEDGVMQGALESLQIPYTGSSVLGSAISMDKYRSKLIWQAMDLLTIPGESFKATNEFSQTKASQLLSRLGMTVMVKPASEGSSLGMSKANNAKQLQEAVIQASQYGGNVLVEQWINGPEYTVAMINDTTLPVVQIQPAHEFYDYQAKYEEAGTEYFCPSNLTNDEENEINAIALKAFQAIDCSGWGRVDFIRNRASGEFYLLEANTVPGMTETSLVPMAAKAAGMSFSDLTIEILKTSLNKNEVISNG